MTDSEILARWQGYKQHPNGVSCYTGELRLIGGTLKWPDYPNDDAAAMSLLDTLVEKGFYPELFYCIGHKWNCTISDDGDLVVQGRDDTRREAVVAACLELIGKEDL